MVEVPGQMNDTGMIISINISRTRSVKKKPGRQGVLIEGLGFEGDAHAGPGTRQVSLLALESIEKMKKMGLEVGPGDFAENITTSGIKLRSLPVGTILEAGRGIVLEVTQIGKTCHTQCAIFRQVGQCVMPEEGIFARVLKGGKIRAGDKINVGRQK
jgi:MOSC domain-containing protein YiiM